MTSSRSVPNDRRLWLPCAAGTVGTCTGSCQRPSRHRDAIALIAGPASAVTVDYSGSNPISATAKGATTLTANGQQLTCDTSSITANVGTGSPSATIIGANWNTCDWNGFPATVTVTNPSWQLNAVSGMTNANNDHNVQGTITNISNVLVDINGWFGHCTFNVSGSVNATFDEDNGKGSQEVTVLASGSTLTVSNRNNLFTCVGLVNNGDSATFAGAYNTSTAAGAINVKP